MANKKDIQRFYRWLNHQPDEFTELRIIPWPPTGTIERYWVQNERDFIKLCQKWSGKRQVYVGINPRKCEGGEAKDVARVTGIPFDIDSSHPKDRAATEEELAQAKKRMVALNSWIRTQGYKAPLIAMSGNGYHIIQKVDIPIDEDLPSKLEAYFHEAPTEGPPQMDSIFDLPRIIKIPGTMSVKGPNTEERPHRLSFILAEGDPEPDANLAEHIQTLEPYTSTAEPYVPTVATPQTDKKIMTIGLKTCFKRFAEEGGFLSDVRSDDHLLRLALVTEAHAKGYSRNQIIDLFRNAGDFNIEITRKKVDHQLGKIAVEGTKNKIWGCPAIRKHHGCLGEKCNQYKKNGTKTDKIIPQDKQLFTEYGYKIQQMPNQGYIIIDIKKDQAIYSFPRPGFRTQQELEETLPDIPKKTIRSQMAELERISGEQQEEQNDKKSQADRLTEYALDQDVELFTDQTDEPYIKWRSSDHHKVYRISSRKVKTWLSGLMLEKEGKSVGDKTINSVQNTLEAMANKGDRKKLYNRVAPDGEGGIYIDLTNEKWQTIHITKNAVKIIDDPPTLFTRYSHQAPQIYPEKEGSLDDLFNWINIKNREDQLLLKIYLITSLIPDIPHPILIFLGPQGCGKSLAMEMIRTLIDPSTVPKLSFNYKHDETALQMYHHYAPYYDNISNIPQWLSDILCRASTGDGFTKRRLYTDEDTVIFQFQRCVGLNGITAYPQKGDLMSRSLVEELKNISKEERKTETEIMKEFKKALPKLFGSILYTLQKTLETYPVKLEALPRMADFAIWGETAARILGYEENEFIKAYMEKIGQQYMTVLKDLPHGRAALLLMTKQNIWQGTAAKLFKQLKEIAATNNINIEGKNNPFPHSAAWTTRRLKEITPMLEEVGIKVNIDSGGEKRGITITREKEGTSLLAEFNKEEEEPPSTKNEEEETILKILAQEKDIGHMELRGQAEYRLDKKYSFDEFTQVLQDMSSRGLLAFDGKTVQTLKTEEEDIDEQH